MKLEVKMICNHCGRETKQEDICIHCGENPKEKVKAVKEEKSEATVGKKPFYKSCWFWGIIIIFAAIGLGNLGGSEKKPETKTEQKTTTEPTKTEPTSTPATPTPTPISNISFSEFDSKFGSSSSNTDIQKDELWKEFKGKRVSWNCEVTEISSKTWLSPLTISFKCNPATWTSDTRLSFDADEPKLLEIKKGDKISFSGVLESYGLFGYTLGEGKIE